MTAEQKALAAVLLFHSGDNWGDEQRAEWQRLTGKPEATTRVLCDTVRAAMTPTSAEATGPALPNGAAAVMDERTPPVTIIYKNHQGDTGPRRIVPLAIMYDNTIWHPTEQWLVHAFDLDRQAERTFALADVIVWGVDSIRLWRGFLHQDPRTEAIALEVSRVSPEDVYGMFVPSMVQPGDKVGVQQ